MNVTDYGKRFAETDYKIPFSDTDTKLNTKYS